jgi:PAP2 superfamily
MNFSSHPWPPRGASETATPYAIPGRLLACTIGVSALAVLAMLIAHRLSVVLTGWPMPLLAGSCLALAAVRYATHNGKSLAQARARHFAESILAFLAMTALGAIASYGMAASSVGFDDARLAHADRLLGFDWIEWYLAVVHHPMLQVLGAAAYASVYVSPVVLIGYLAWTGRQGAARRFLLTFWLSIVVTLLLFPLLPARGALAYLWHGPIPYMPTNGLYQDAIIPALRAHTMRAIDFGALRGLVCAPSFHTVCGVLFIAWSWPLVRLRWTLVPLNLAMLAATPVEGTHYLIDMILGALVAIAAIAAVRWFIDGVAAPDLALSVPRPRPLPR